MKKLRKQALALLLAAAMAVSAGCSSGSTPVSSSEPDAGVTSSQDASGQPAPAGDAASGSYKAGTYTASAKGMGGDVPVTVTFSDTAITEVKVGEHKETQGIADAPIERIPAAIVENQSLQVEAVAGATITSNAILAAVADCVTQAGGDAQALQSKEIAKEKLEDETIDTDIVVVGAGIAGLSAAIEAANAGAKVVLLEKMGSTGGASITCGGEVLAAGTQLQKDQGIEDNTKDLGDLWVQKGEGQVDEALLRYIADNSPETITWMQSMGVEFQGVTTPTSYPWQDPMRCHKTASGSGAGFILPLTEKAKELGVDIRLETPAKSLIKDGETVKGVVAENAGRTVTVNAKNVILATGGFGNNDELMKQYCPLVPISGVHVGEANQGDGLIMARDAGAEIVAGGGAIALSIDMGPTGYFEPYGQFLYVSPQGERFMNEAEYWFSRTRKLYDMGGYCYAIMDSKTQNENWDAAVEKGTAFRADTLDDLAAQLKMEPAALKATVEKYNAACAAGKDDEFGKPATNIGMYLTQGATEENPGIIKQETKEMNLLTSIETGPFYALKLEINSLSGTFGGPKVNAQGQALKADGQAIAGLYAAGEVASGDLLYKEYPCSGSAIQMYCRMGRDAGKAAAAEALAA